MDNKIITVLGSSGSVGKQALEVAEANGFRVFAISVNNDITTGEEQIRKFAPKYCAVADEESAKQLRVAVADTDTVISSGSKAIEELATMREGGILLNSILGSAGLKPTLAGLRAGRRVALSNKESLVVAGDIVMNAAKDSSGELIPVDSEHSAIFQCLSCGKKNEVKRLILTASGGSLYGKTKAELDTVTVDEVLGHPTWKMGKKITVDSASLMNKGFEVIEAHYLFDMPYEKIDVIIHRESIIHSMVEYIDNSIISQMSLPDMRNPIAHALGCPERLPSKLRSFDFTKSLTFGKVDYESFPSLSLAYEVGKAGGILPCVMNAADETAVEAFLHGRIRFTDIFKTVAEVVKTFERENIVNPTLTQIFEADVEARFRATELINSPPVEGCRREAVGWSNI
jgi:1-deoxy-D-xylulose-5-phosphate reductoisomerase